MDLRPITEKQKSQYNKLTKAFQLALHKNPFSQKFQELRQKAKRQIF